MFAMLELALNLLRRFISQYGPITDSIERTPSIDPPMEKAEHVVILGEKRFEPSARDDTYICTIHGQNVPWFVAKGKAIRAATAQTLKRSKVKLALVAPAARHPLSVPAALCRQAAPRTC
jgi:hypothetical protein